MKIALVGDVHVIVERIVESSNRVKFSNQNILNSPLALPTNVNLFLVSAGSLSSGETLFTGERREKNCLFLFEVGSLNKLGIISSRTKLLKYSFVTDCKF